MRAQNNLKICQFWPSGFCFRCLKSTISDIELFILKAFFKKSIVFNSNDHANRVKHICSEEKHKQWLWAIWPLASSLATQVLRIFILTMSGHVCFVLQYKVPFFCTDISLNSIFPVFRQCYSTGTAFFLHLFSNVY